MRQIRFDRRAVAFYLGVGALRRECLLAPTLLAVLMRPEQAPRSRLAERGKRSPSQEPVLTVKSSIGFYRKRPMFQNVAKNGANTMQGKALGIWRKTLEEFNEVEGAEVDVDMDRVQRIVLHNIQMEGIRYIRFYYVLTEALRNTVHI